jgi:hypothetical protein
MLYRPLSLVSAVAAMLFFVVGGMPAAAATIAFSGTFDDPTAPEADGDTILLNNDPTSESYITQVVFDLTTAAATVTFDAAGSPFTPTGGSGVITGLSSAVFTGTQILTLVFTDFAPGETFTFTVDLDDNNTRVDANRIAGATVTATFAAGGGTSLAATAIDPPTGPGRSVSWSAGSAVIVPEPRAGLLLAIGLTALAWRDRSTRPGPTAKLG